MNELRGAFVGVQQVLDWPLFQAGSITYTAGRVIAIVALLFSIFGLTRWARDWTVRRLMRRPGVQVGVAHAVASIVRYVLVFAGLLILLETSGIDLSSLMVVAGALGVGIGLGLQGITNNFVSGLILLIERPIKVGDRIEIGDVSGDVISIAPRATTVVTNDHITVIVPNSHFVSSQVVNWSHGAPEVRISVPVPVAYDSDPQQVRGILLAVAASHSGVLEEPKPDVLFQGFGDSALQFLLRVWTREYTARPGVLKSDLNYLLHMALRDAKVEIPFPQRTLHIRSGAGPQAS